jgi:hypothetical protein
LRGAAAFGSSFLRLGGSRSRGGFSQASEIKRGDNENLDEEAHDSVRRAESQNHAAAARAHRGMMRRCHDVFTPVTRSNCEGLNGAACKSSLIRGITAKNLSEAGEILNQLWRQLCGLQFI